MPLKTFEWLGISLDQPLLVQNPVATFTTSSRCRVFEKDLIECSHGIGHIRSQKECQLEYEDFMECVHGYKLMERLTTIRMQRDKLVKEGKYTKPPKHAGEFDDMP